MPGGTSSSGISFVHCVVEAGCGPPGSARTARRVLRPFEVRTARLQGAMAARNVVAIVSRMSSKGRSLGPSYPQRYRSSIPEISMIEGHVSRSESRPSPPPRGSLFSMRDLDWRSRTYRGANRDLPEGEGSFFSPKGGWKGDVGGEGPSDPVPWTYGIGRHRYLYDRK